MNLTQLTTVAEIQIIYKSNTKPSERPQLTTSSETYQLLKKLWDENTVELREEFKILLLNRANKVIGVYQHSIGGLSGTVADPKHIWATALLANAAGIIIAHNHPSGQTQPSQADINLTKKLKEGGKLLEISLLDHIVYTPHAYYSFADEGIL